MNVPACRLLIPFLACFTVLSCADSGPGSSIDEAPVAREAGPAFTDFGEYVVHYNAIPTQQLSADDAKTYGITRSKNRALLNVVIQHKRDDGSVEPISGRVTANTSNLTGQLKNLTLKKVTEAQAVYYIGEISVSNGETLNFDLAVTPEGSDEELKAKFQQQFFTN